eukprot:1871899-Prymnesium_polylepis.1
MNPDPTRDDCVHSEEEESASDDDDGGGGGGGGDAADEVTLHVDSIVDNEGDEGDAQPAEAVELDAEA